MRHTIYSLCFCNILRRYGVQLPNCEGRIGMAAVVFGNAGPDWLQLAQHVKKELPSYAIPYFVRPMSAQDITGTFKHRKVELVKDGWTAGGDAVFFYGKQCRARARRCEITHGTQTLSPVTTFPSTTTSSAA